MIDADAGIAPPGAGLEIPKGESLFRSDCAQGVGHAEIAEDAEFFEAFRPVERVAPPGVGVVGVDRGGNEVEVTHHHKGLFQFEPRLNEAVEPIHPGQLIREFFRIHRVTVRQVDIADPHHPASDGKHALDQPRLLVGIIAGQAAMHLIEGDFGKQGDPVPAFLAVGFDIIAQRLDFGARKALVDGLYFLQADDVRPFLFEPTQQQLDPGLDAVDVPGGYAQGHVRQRSWCRSRRRRPHWGS